jgi:hypothetical protein
MPVVVPVVVVVCVWVFKGTARAGRGWEREGSNMAIRAIICCGQSELWIEGQLRQHACDGQIGSATM